MSSRVPSTLAVVVVAAGSGTRLGRAEPKAFVRLAGVTLLEHAIRGVSGVSEPIQLVVVAPADRLADASAIARRADPDAADAVRVVAGGATRQASVAAGLAALEPHVEVVLVHDAARPLTPSAVFERVASQVRAKACGVVPALRARTLR